MIQEIEPPKPMDDTELLAIIDRERNLAHGYQDELSEQRRKALYYYQGEAKEDLSPPEIDGRSAVVSKDVMEAVEWVLPSLIRIFTSSDDVVAFIPTKPGQEASAETATKYCNWVLNGDSRNNGFIIYHDAFKNSLIQRMAWVKVYHEEAYDERQEKYAGQSPAELMMLQQDPDVTIVAVQQEQEAVIADDGVTVIQPPYVTVTCIRRAYAGYTKVVGVPPEEVFVSKDSRDIEDLRFICHERRVTPSDLISMGYPQELVDQLGDDRSGETGEEDERDEMSSKWGMMEDDGADESQREITVVEAYVKVDYDQDGIAEWRCVKKSGTHILSNDVVDDHPFALATPILMPYQLIGMSIYDLLADIQRIKTSIQRQMLDNMYLQNNVRTEVVPGQVNLDDLLNPKPGGAIRVKQIGAMREIAPTNLIGNSLEALNAIDAVRQRRSGVNDMGSGLTADNLTNTPVGTIAQMVDQRNERVELMARVYAETFVKRLYKLILKCASQYQRDSLQILAAGQFLEVNPRDWQTNYNMQVSVGLGAQSKQAQIASFQMLMTVQRELLQAGLATPEQIGNAAVKLVEAMGHKDASRYVVDPSKLPPGQQIQGPPPPQDPNQSLAQAQVQAEQIKAQTAQQKAQIDAQIRQQELVNESQKAQLQAEVDVMVARIKAETDLAIAQMGDQTERDVENSKLALEVQKDIIPAIDTANAVGQVAQTIAAMQQELDNFKNAVAGIMSKPRNAKIVPIYDQSGRISDARIVEE